MSDIVCLHPNTSLKPKSVLTHNSRVVPVKYWMEITAAVVGHVSFRNKTYESISAITSWRDASFNALSLIVVCAFASFGYGLQFRTIPKSSEIVPFWKVLTSTRMNFS